MKLNMKTKMIKGVVKCVGQSILYAKKFQKRQQ